MRVAGLPRRLVPQAGGDALALLRVKALVEPCSDEVGGLVPEQGVHGRRHVPDGQVRLEHDDQVVRVLHEGAETCLATPLRQVVGDLEAFERQGDLPGEHLEALLEMPRERAGARHANHALQPLAHHDRSDDRPRRTHAGERPRGSDLTAERRGDLAHPDDGSLAHLELRPRAEVDVDVRLLRATGQVDRRLSADTADLVAGLRDSQGGGTGLQCELALGDALVPCGEADETRGEQAGEQHAGEKRHAANPILGHECLVADQHEHGEHGRREQGETPAGRPRLGRVTRLGEPPHVRVQCRRTPEQQGTEGQREEQGSRPRPVVDDRERNGAGGERLGRRRTTDDPPLRPAHRGQQQPRRDPEHRRAHRDAGQEADPGCQAERGVEQSGPDEQQPCHAESAERDDARIGDRRPVAGDSAAADEHGERDRHGHRAGEREHAGHGREARLLRQLGGEDRSGCPGCDEHARRCDQVPRQPLGRAIEVQPHEDCCSRGSGDGQRPHADRDCVLTQEHERHHRQHAGGEIGVQPPHRPRIGREHVRVERRSGAHRLPYTSRSGRP